MSDINLDDIVTEDQAIDFLEKQLKRGTGAKKNETESFSIFSFATSSELISFLMQEMKQSWWNVMGVPKVNGEYITFKSPFKVFYGREDSTPSFQIRWKDGYWFDNTDVARIIFSEHYPEKRGSENPANGNIALFLAFFGKNARPSAKLRNPEDKSEGFSVLRHDELFYKEFFNEKLQSCSPEEAHKIVHYIHQECIAAKTMLLDGEHLENMRKVKPLWAERLADIFRIDTIGYIPAEKAMVFFYISPEGNFDFAVKKYYFTSDKKRKHVHASIFSLVEGSPAFGEFSTTKLQKESIFFASKDLPLSREKGKLTTQIRKFVVPTERIPSSTMFFTEGEPDAVTLALLGFNASNFKNQLEDGRVTQKSVVREFAEYTDNIVLADTGDDRNAGMAANFARALGNLSRMQGRQNAVMFLDREDFAENSIHADVDTLKSNVDITDLLTEKLSKKPIGEQIVEAENIIIKLRQKQQKISYAFSSVISADTILPVGDTPSSVKLRESRLDHLKKAGDANSARISQTILDSTPKENVAENIDEFAIDDAISGVAAKFFLRIIRPYSGHALHTSQMAFDCSALPAGKQDGGKKCEKCPVWAMREDLSELDQNFSEFSKANNFAKIPTIMGRIPSGSRLELRMIPTIVQSKSNIRINDVYIYNGMTCDPKFTYGIEEEKIFIANIEFAPGSSRQVLTYNDKLFISDSDIMRNMGMLCETHGYFAKTVIQDVGNKGGVVNSLTIKPVFIIVSMKRADFADEEMQKKVKGRSEELASRKTKAVPELFFETVAINEVKPPEVIPATDKENVKNIVQATVNDVMHRMGSFSNYRATLATLFSANSGGFIYTESGQNFYGGFSIGLYGLPSCGKTHIAKTILRLFSSHNFGIRSNEVIKGIMQTAGCKLTTFIPSGTVGGKYIRPVPVEHDLDFYVFDESHGSALNAKAVYRVFDPLLTLTWEGTAVATGTFTAQANMTGGNTNAFTETARCPFIFLGNLVTRKSSFTLKGDTENPNETGVKDASTRQIYENQLTEMPDEFGFPDITALHKRILFMWAYPREAKISEMDYETYVKECKKAGIPDDEIVLQGRTNLNHPTHSIAEFYSILYQFFTQFRHDRATRGVLLESNAEEESYNLARNFIDSKISKAFRVQRGYELEGIARRIVGIANVVSLFRFDSKITVEDVQLAEEYLTSIWRDVQALESYDIVDEIRDKILSTNTDRPRLEGFTKPWEYPFFRYAVLDDTGDFKSMGEIKLFLSQFEPKRLSARESSTWAVPFSIVGIVENFDRNYRGEKTRENSQLGELLDVTQDKNKQFERLFGIRPIPEIRKREYLVREEYFRSIIRTVEILNASDVIDD